ncbi:FAST kinase domain-containing protein 4 [Monomorium pharaonis]|uniref:FAST kinase domain-containing protein 4 n=1 Tax=Monomorium pharaonis TaxID=307658 RepID=UPI00063FB985|nr:FAST kinase domain-containing protein 4 [Monomorium pharaonis]
MLQFSAMLYTATSRLAPRSPTWRLTALVACNSSTTITGEQLAISANDNAKFSEVQAGLQEKSEQKSKETDMQMTEETNDTKSSRNDRIFSEQLKAAESVNDLLDLALLPSLSKHNALKLISSITNQINSRKSQVIDIEADERFIHLRKIVDDERKTHKFDLSKYSQLSTPAMIAVIASLREQEKRPASLLKMLSYNIAKYNSTLNLKQCSTLLYSMSLLNFPDKVLLEKIANDLLECIPESDSTTVNTAILTSLGFLRYKNENVLDAFCDTFFKQSMKYKLLDYSSILQTFAALQYKSEKANAFVKKFAEYVSPFQTSLVEWLDIVWSLAVLDAAKPQHVKYILDPTFLKKLITSSKLNIARKLKILNINAVAQFILKDYEGPLLEKDSNFYNVPIVRSNEKQMFIEALSKALKEILPSSSYFKTNVDTNMGFCLDAEYRLDDQHRFVKVEDWNKQTNVRRIAIMVHNYHDYCIGENDDDLIGSAYVYIQLLKARGYDVITISYKNFSLQDNIKTRVCYLEQCMNSMQEIKSAKQTQST